VLSPPACTLLQFKVYLGIELFVWFPGLYVSCLWLQPTVRIMGTRLGKRGVQAASDALLRWSPSWHASVAKLGANVYGGTHKRAAAEWLLLNKVLAPISFPTKLWVAHKIVESRKAHSACLASGGSASDRRGGSFRGGVAGVAADGNAEG
jgi:hypothetical protein